ncbi:MAG: hypothetical protein ACYTEZ_14410 [Planctomycetota bacterium]
MNDDQLLSLYLDGRLAPAEAAALERRLAAEPALSADLAALRRLQELSEGLAAAEAGFTADDVRLRALAHQGGRWWRRVAVAAAAVLALAITHGGAFLLGTQRGGEGKPSPVEATEAFLSRAAQLDVEAPPDRLRHMLDDLRQQTRTQLIALAEPGTAGPRVARLADAVRQLDLVLDQQEDPGFVGIAVSMIARSSLEGGPQLRFVPATAKSYTRLDPMGAGRFRFTYMQTVGGVPHVVVDEGTVPELEARHRSFEFVQEEE